MLLEFAAKVFKMLPGQARQAISRSVQSKFTVSAAAIVRNERGEVLLLDHLLRPRSGWGLPGGFLEKNEQPEAAVRREVREETGLEMKDVVLHRVRTLGRHIEVIFVATGVGEAAVNSREIKRLQWFALDEVPPEMSLDIQFLLRGAQARDE
jgi:8-oxo-dGTP diphosphatase